MTRTAVIIINKTTTTLTDVDKETLLKALALAPEDTKEIEHMGNLSIVTHTGPIERVATMILMEDIAHDEKSVSAFVAPIINDTVNLYLDEPADDHPIPYSYYQAGDGGVVTAYLYISIDRVIEDELRQLGK